MKAARKNAPAAPATLTALNEKQREFVVAFMGPASGNASEAARQVGCVDPEVEGKELLASPGTLDAISDLLGIPYEDVIRWRDAANGLLNEPIWDSDALQKYWTTTARDGEESSTARLTASKLLAQSQAMFVERHEHQVDARVEAVMAATPEEIEDSVVKALRKDPALWARIQQRVEETSGEET